MRHPLAGITVVALEHAVAAPFATRQLADLGARVITGADVFVQNLVPGAVERQDAPAKAEWMSQSAYFSRYGEEEPRRTAARCSSASRTIANGPPSATRCWPARIPPVDVAGQEPVMAPVSALGQHNAVIRAEFGDG